MPAPTAGRRSTVRTGQETSMLEAFMAVVEAVSSWGRCRSRGRRVAAKITHLAGYRPCVTALSRHWAVTIDSARRGE